MGLGRGIGMAIMYALFVYAGVVSYAVARLGASIQRSRQGGKN